MTLSLSILQKSLHGLGLEEVEEFEQVEEESEIVTVYSLEVILSQPQHSQPPTPNLTGVPLVRGFSLISEAGLWQGNALLQLYPRNLFRFVLSFLSLTNMKPNLPNTSRITSHITPYQAPFSVKSLLNSTVASFIACLALANTFLSSWISIFDVNIRYWSTRSTRIFVALSSVGLPTLGDHCWAKCARAGWIELSHYLLNYSGLDILLPVLFARPCCRSENTSLGPPNHTHSPEDGDNHNEYGQPRSGQWANPDGSRRRTEAGVWSHGSFDTGDPFAPPLWAERQIEYLRWLESEARKLGCALVPLPWLFPPTSSQPTYQFAVSPTPPVPIPSQPGPSASTVLERDSEFNHTGIFATLQTTDRRNGGMLDNLQFDAPAPGGSSLHPINTYSTMPSDLALDIPPDLCLDPLPSDLLRDIRILIGDPNPSQQRETAESSMDQLGQLSNHALDGLGSFSDTLDISHSSFVAQTSSINLNAHAPGPLGYSNANSFYSVLEPSLATMENGMTAALLEHNPAYSIYAHHAGVGFMQSDQTHADQLQSSSSVGYISHHHNQEPSTDASSRSTINPDLQENQAYMAESSISYTFCNYTPADFRGDGGVGG